MTQATKDWPKPVIAGAFALANTGDVSAAIDAGDGTWWILKQTGRRKAMTRTLADATQQIRNKLSREKRVDAQKQFIDALRARSGITSSKMPSRTLFGFPSLWSFRSIHRVKLWHTL